MGAFRTLDIMGNSIWKNDLKSCHYVNRLVDAHKGDPHHKHIDVNVYAPEGHLLGDLFDSLNFKPEQIKGLIEEGRKAESCSLGEFLSRRKTIIPKSL
jgi:hypothetical protein